MGWEVPTEIVGNTFSVILTSNDELNGVDLGDFRLRRADAVFTNLTDSNAVLSAVSGTNNWRIDITLTGTFDHDFQIRLINNRLQHNENNVPASNLNSDVFHVDSSVGVVNTAPSFSLSAYTFNNIGIAVNSVVGSVVATDINNDDITYSLTGTDASSFSIDSNGQITVATALDFSESYSFNVVADDGEDTTSVGVSVSTASAPDLVLSITLDETNVEAGSEVTSTFTFNQAPSGFTDSDVDVTAGATKGALTSVSATVFQMTITAPATGDGTVVVSVDADVVTPGNNAASVSFTYFTDAIIAITLSETVIDTGSIVLATFTSNKDISNFTASDVDVSAGLIKGALIVVSARVYRMQITAPSTGTGIGTISIASDAVSPGNVAAIASFSYVEPDAILTLSVNHASVRPGSLVTVTFSFNRSVGFLESYIDITGGGVGQNFRGSGSLYMIDISVPSSGSGVVFVSVDADVVNGGNNSAMICVVYTSADQPVWADETMLELNIDSNDTGMLDVLSLVSNAHTVVPTFGIRRWSSFDGRYLNISNSPIVAEQQSYSFRFEAIGTGGAVRARVRVIVNGSKLASLNNMILMKHPLNYEKGRVTVTGATTVVNEVRDNKYDTFTTEKMLTINMALDGMATKIDYVFVIGKNIDSYRFSPVGATGFTSRAIPTRVKNVEGRVVDTTFRGLQYDLVPLEDTIEAQSVNMVFTGANAEIYAIMLLESGYQVNANSSFVEVIRGKVDRSGGIHNTTKGGIERYAPIGLARHKHTCQYLLTFEGNEKYDEFLQWIEDNVNCVQSEEFNRFPWAVYLNTFPDMEFNAEYITRYKEVGNHLMFNTEER